MTKTSQRRYTIFDQFCLSLDRGLQTLSSSTMNCRRENPAKDMKSDVLTSSERRRSAALMRVNHTGEVCAQALYQGQALTATLPNVRGKLQEAADEEMDHLAWCEQRISELNDRTSLLNPLWYSSSFAIGALAGIAGDKWSLGFLAETENQVENHLGRHLKRLPENDHASRAIVAQMKIDEAAHASTAINAGAAILPLPIKIMMKVSSKIMTKLTYWV